MCVVRCESSDRYTSLRMQPADTCVYLQRGSNAEFHRPVKIESSSTLNQPKTGSRAPKSSIVIVSVDDLPLSSSKTRAGEESHPRDRLTTCAPHLLNPRTHPRPAKTDVVVLSSAAPNARFNLVVLCASTSPLTDTPEPMG